MAVRKSDSDIAQAIFTVNRHAKTAPDNQYLYALKKESLTTMILQGRAKKIGLHFSKNPRKSQQQSSVLVKCGDYYFHMLPKKEDFDQLDHLGHLDESYRNPPSRMNLKVAKEILSDLTGLQPEKKPQSTPAISQQYKPRSMERFYTPKKSYFD
ncbi:YkyB family protein [Planococcus sp. N028]|uniref:YkyB family protein n=1 Tax=Planococcus shixiaomingii TaxID=3058393 RepID=A0ABT8N0K1_9BACL|nr:MULTISPECIES: YkyB family protein [unclassified Planococcus (in: firmicutes)]MDN7241422.1 YkyB family protein [Planococcus sp. N028]WKA53676.1 YkyB family protein [Planococcus sp. N022]